MTETLYKALALDGSANNAGTGKWHLPKGKRPGKWMPAISPVVPCQSGYHVTTIDNLLRWIAPTVYEVEVRGDIVDHSDKLVASQARLIRATAWNEQTARLFAADCAEHVLHLWTKRYPNDPRVADCIAEVRRFANGEATLDEMRQARSAAYAAFDAAAYAAYDAAAYDAAAYAAVYAAYDAAAYDAAAYAAVYAAYAAAYAVVYDAAARVARLAERKWQTERLAQYLSGEVN
jgi:hypothetical protein